MHSTIVSLSALALAPLALGKTFNVNVGQNGLTFTPDHIVAAPGDKVDFHYFPKNHSVVASSFAAPCVPVKPDGGIFSGFQPTTSQSPNVFEVTINDTKPVWIYCAQAKHCEMGMSMVINEPKTANTLAAYQAAAKNVTASGSPPHVGGGIFVKSSSTSTATASSSSGTGTGSSSFSSSSSSSSSSASSSSNGTYHSNSPSSSSSSSGSNLGSSSSSSSSNSGYSNTGSDSSSNTGSKSGSGSSPYSSGSSSSGGKSGSSSSSGKGSSASTAPGSSSSVLSFTGAAAPALVSGMVQVALAAAGVIAGSFLML